MSFVDLIVAALNFFGGVVGAFGHVATVCASTPPVALHVTAQSGLELAQATIRSALVGTPTC